VTRLTSVNLSAADTLRYAVTLTFDLMTLTLDPLT